MSVNVTQIMATPDRVAGPPGHMNQPTADVIPLIPRHDDGDFFTPVQEIGEEGLGYLLVPSEAPGMSVIQAARFPLHVANGLGKAAYSLARHYSGGLLDRFGTEPERRIMQAGDQERVVLVTRREGATMTEAQVVGLSELEIGSASMMHESVAAQYPDRDVVSIMTPGVTLSGKTLSLSEGFNRPLAVTAAENNQLIAELAEDNPTHMTGTSLGSAIVMHMAEQNLEAGESAMVNVAGVNLVSLAVGARNIPEAERAGEADADDEAYIAKLTEEFFEHMGGDIARMFFKHPAKAAECAAVIVAYAVAPHKLPNRIAAMAGNVRGVQAGIDWAVVKAIAQAYPMHIVGGERDPLMQAQLPQLVALRQPAPNTSIRVLEGLGHAMTINSPETAGHLAEMEHEGPALALAA